MTGGTFFTRPSSLWEYASCTGGAECPSHVHVHGCFRDDGTCDRHSDHDPAERCCGCRASWLVEASARMASLTRATVTSGAGSRVRTTLRALVLRPHLTRGTNDLHASRTLLMCACEPGYVCLTHRDTREDDGWIEPEPPEPFYANEEEA